MIEKPIYSKCYLQLNLIDHSNGAGVSIRPITLSPFPITLDSKGLEVFTRHSANISIFYTSYFTNIFNSVLKGNHFGHSWILYLILNCYLSRYPEISLKALWILASLCGFLFSVIFSI